MDKPVSQKYDDLSILERRQLRIRYIEFQKNRCANCGESLDALPPLRISNQPINWGLFPPGFKRHPIHLHHSHKTGMTIGAVHMRCNAWLWQYKGE